MAVVVDTSVLYAMTDRAEPSHAECVAALAAEPEAVVLPEPVLPEICYLISSRLGPRTELDFLNGLIESDWRVEPMTPADLLRTATVLRDYFDADLGFVDAAVVAVAERLAIRRIYTLDRRDFAMVRPTHVSAFELLP